MKHPMQPIVKDDNEVMRFKENTIVSYLLEKVRRQGITMNELAALNFSNEDREQFAQLIGYSVSGFGDLSYVNPDSVKAADLVVRAGVTPEVAADLVVETELSILREALREPIARLYGKHPDDFKRYGS